MKGCRPLTDAEVQLVSRSFGGTYAARDRALFILGIKSGFRIAELLSIRVGDVWQHKRMVDQVMVRRAHMKQKREGRTVLLHPDAKAALATWLLVLRQQPDVTTQTYVFPSHKGGNRPISPVQAWRILRDACETNGCVRTHATWFLAEQSVDLPPQKEEKHALPLLCVNQDQSAPRSHGIRLPPLSLS
jgi:integrase